MMAVRRRIYGRPGIGAAWATSGVTLNPAALALVPTKSGRGGFGKFYSMPTSRCNQRTYAVISKTTSSVTWGSAGMSPNLQW